jgi:hypothetical protein
VPDAPVASDPDHYIAVMAIGTAMDRETPVTKALIMEVVTGFLARPGTREHAAASTMEFDKTRAAVIRMLEQTGRAAMVAPELRAEPPKR